MTTDPASLLGIANDAQRAILGRALKEPGCIDTQIGAATC